MKKNVEIIEDFETWKLERKKREGRNKQPKENKIFKIHQEKVGNKFRMYINEETLTLKNSNFKN